MQMRPGGPPGAADHANHFTGTHRLARKGPETRHVGIAGKQSMAVIDLHDITIAGTLANESHFATSRRIDRRTGGPLEVEPGMEIRSASEWIRAIAKAR